MSETSKELLDKLRKKPKPVEKKEITIKIPKSEQPVNITTKIKDRRPTAQIERTEILEKLGIRPTVTSTISSAKIKQEEEEFKLAEQLKDTSIGPEAATSNEDQEVRETTVLPTVTEKPKEEGESTILPTVTEKSKEELEELDELDEEALLAALGEEDESVTLKPKTIVKTDKSKKTTRKTIKDDGTLLKAPPKDLDKIVNRIPKEKDKIIIKASAYYLNNREIFINFINSLLKDYKTKLASLDEYSCDSKGDGSFTLLTHQNIVRDYINLLTPYRGLLLFHGLGSGKTCSSIAIAEGIKSDKEVIIMLPKSLETNYKQELKKCGDELYRNNQYWEKINTIDDPTLIEPLAYILSLSPKFIEKQGGAWFINKDKPANYNSLSPENQKSLNEQIEKMILNKYQFIRYNGLREKRLNELVAKSGGNPFSNKIIVIDEAHNLISRIVNQLKRPKSIAMRLYDYLKSAKNTRIVLLSGTPIINYPHEVAIMMNILRGNINTWNFQLQNNSKGKFKLTQESLIELFKTNLQSNFDYLHFKSTPEPMLTITRNPYGFYPIYDKGEYKGVQLNESGNIDDETFVRVVTEILATKNISIVNDATEPISYDCLPDNKDQFSAKFIEDGKGKEPTQVKNMDLFKRRILGLVSYFPDIEALLPRYNREDDLNLVLVPMSKFQFSVYEEARAEERKIERRNAKKRAKKGSGDGLFDDSTSTYRIFSRAFCNFVFPKEKTSDGTQISRPLPRESLELTNVISETANEDLLDAVVVQEELEDGIEGEPDPVNEEEAKENLSYAARIRKALQLLEQNSDKYLTPEGLEIYSPKFLNILSRILNDTLIGTHLIYSQFRTLEGIGILALVLNANGFAQFRIAKVGGEWKLNIKEEDKAKPKYIFYTGTELPEEKEVLRNIFNSNWDSLDTPETSSLKKELLELEKTNPIIQEGSEERNPRNLYGDIIKVIMITASGAEGISLNNVRFVHITEPYWHPVRINQVIGRARRICSHKNLPIDKQTVEVFLYLMEFTQEQVDTASKELKQQDKSKLDKSTYMNYKTLEDPYLTSDQALFEISSQKEIVTQGILTSMKEASIDCNLHNPIGSSKELKCFTIGSPNPSKFAYTPSISAGQDDKDKVMNEKEVKLVLKRVTLEGVDYAYNHAVLIKDNEDESGIVKTSIYMLDSVKTGNPLPVGTLYFKNTAKPDEDPKFKPKNYTFFATHKK